ncbi:uncharacterized protein LOC123533852 [Mercenaria mercenaria]|uniref:uncharacterized protein LOC123533852 n=1 Tax=Mercenaria mercenaria TaxID=6596 RepID=UPI00234F20B4|nr:uncharacterized protein LOC123533852 [Mercenaria mercenaria]
MASQIIMLLSLFCLLILIGPGVNALQCYSCEGCNDPFKSSGVSTTDCSESCEKTKGEMNGVQYVKRSCGSGTETKCSDQNVEGVEVTLCTCTTDKCNGVDRANMHLMTSLTFTAFLIVARRYMF